MGIEPRLWEGIGAEVVEDRKGVLKQSLPGAEYVVYGNLKRVGNPDLLDGVTGEASKLN